jgi:hypothetical protein
MAFRVPESARRRGGQSREEDTPARKFLAQPEYGNKE